MKDKINKLIEKPLLMSIIGWVLFPGMYLLVGIFTTLDLSVEVSFIIASPAALVGFAAWVMAFAVSLRSLIQGRLIAVSIGGLVSSIIPLIFLGYGFWIAANGGR